MMQTYSSEYPLCLVDMKWVRRHLSICSVEQMLSLYEENHETLSQLFAEVLLENKMLSVFRLAKIEGRGLNYINRNNVSVTISAEDMTQQDFNTYISTQDFFSSYINELKENDVRFKIEEVTQYIQNYNA